MVHLGFLRAHPLVKPSLLTAVASCWLVSLTPFSPLCLPVHPAHLHSPSPFVQNFQFARWFLFLGNNFVREEIIHPLPVCLYPTARCMKRHSSLKLPANNWAVGTWAKSQRMSEPEGQSQEPDQGSPAGPHGLGMRFPEPPSAARGLAQSG